jgi:lysophosphatidic acid acyltransferase/lysophosphatidylinositol acyltransferase
MLLEWWSGTECTLYTDPRAYSKYGKENAIVVLNHKFEIDFLCGWSLAERFGILGVSEKCICPHFSLHQHCDLPVCS